MIVQTSSHKKRVSAIGAALQVVSALNSWMYLRSSNLYKSNRDTNTIIQKSNEESVTNYILMLKPIIEEDSYLNLSSSMAFENHVFASICDTHPMIFNNVRLVFAKTNTHDTQLFKDPMNCWVVKIEEHPMALDPSPWVNYQG